MLFGVARFTAWHQIALGRSPPSAYRNDVIHRDLFFGHLQLAVIAKSAIGNQVLPPTGFANSSCLFALNFIGLVVQSTSVIEANFYGAQAFNGCILVVVFNFSLF